MHFGVEAAKNYAEGSNFNREIARLCRILCTQVEEVSYSISTSLICLCCLELHLLNKISLNYVQKRAPSDRGNDSFSAFLLRTTLHANLRTNPGHPFIHYKTIVPSMPDARYISFELSERTAGPKRTRRLLI